MGESNSSKILTQHPDDTSACPYDVFLRTVSGTADTSLTPAVVTGAQADNDANRGDHTFIETQEFFNNSSVAMEHTTTVTPQRKRVSARHGQNILRHRGSAHQQADTTRLKRLLPRRLSAKMRKSRTSRPRTPLPLRRSAFVR